MHSGEKEGLMLQMRRLWWLMGQIERPSPRLGVLAARLDCSFCMVVGE